MRKRLVPALLILALGLLPGAQAVGCPSGRAEAAAGHAHADHSVGQAGHHHPEGTAPHDVLGPAPGAEASSPLEAPSGHSGPECCCGSSQVAASVVCEGVRVRTLDAFPAFPVAARLGMPAEPVRLARDPRRLRPGERRSPYVRNRAPLLI